MNYYERHLGDYAKDTAHLTMLEHGAYGLLLDRYYSTEAGIPAGEAHRVSRARTSAEKAAVDAVLNEFFKLLDGVWVSKRAQEEITKVQNKIKVAQENGKRGGRPKTNPNETHEKPSGLSVGFENETQVKAHQTPDTRHQSPETKDNTHMSGTPDDSPPKHGKKTNGHRPECIAILDFLNQKQGSSYKPVEAHLKLIAARLAEGYEVQEFKSVIARKVNEWGGTDMAKYIRPKTLFNATNFSNYVGELGTELIPHKERT